MNTRRRFMTGGLLAAGGASLLSVEDVLGGHAPRRTERKPRIERYTDAEARAFLRDRAKSDRAFAENHSRSMRHFATRGRHEAQHVLVATLTGAALSATKSSSPIDNLLDRFIPRLHADTYYDSDGSLILTTMGGEDAVWEGNLYFNNTSYGAWAGCDSGIDTAETEYASILWESGTDAGATGGVVIESPPVQTWEGIACGDAAQIAQKINRNTLVYWIPWAIGGAIGCAASGPLYFQCAGLMAIGALVATGLTQIASWAMACGCQYMAWACI